MAPLQDDDANPKVVSSQRFIKLLKFSPENSSTDKPSQRAAGHTHVTESIPLRPGIY